MSKLTPAQRSYLEAAAQRPLAFAAVRHSTSMRCVNLMVQAGLLRRDTDRRQYVITPSGRAALASIEAAK